MKRNLFLLAIFLSLSFFAQAQFYVDKNHPSASDANNGSETQPWLTIQHGVSQMTPGQTLFIKAGTYYERIDIDVSGTPGNIITIKNFPNDAVIISGEQSSGVASNTAGSIIWTDNAYLRIEGLHLTKNEINYAQGLTLQGEAHHIEVVNNKVSEINFSTNPNAAVDENTNAVPMSALGDAGGAAPDSVHHISFIGNEIFNNRTGYSENLTLGGNVSHFLMENNYIHDNKNIGIDATGNYGECPVPAFDHPRYGVIKNNHVHDCQSGYSPAAGLYIDGGYNIVVENNLSYNNGYGGEIGCEQSGETKNVIFRNNVFHHNVVAGMHVGAYNAQTQGNVRSCQVYNNTFYMNDTGSNFHGEFIWTKSVDCKIFNNILFVNSQNVLLYAYRTQSNLYFDYNLIYSANGVATSIETTTDGENNGGNSYEGLSAFYTATGYGSNSLFGDPLFVNVNTNDFHVASNSLAVNAGNPNHSPAPEEKDLDGAARAVGVVDIGVDEQASPLPVEYLSPLQARLQPNGISLYWKTAVEINADLFIIQRLTSNTVWEDVQTVKAGLFNYQVLDSRPQKGINVYRLKQVDLDGDYSLSNMVNVVWEGIYPVRLYPNPTSGITHFAADKTYNVKVINMLGQVVFLAGKVNELPQFESGVYSVIVFSDAGQIKNTIRLVVE